MRVILLIAAVLMLSGCANKTVTKSEFVERIAVANFGEVVVTGVPEFAYCFNLKPDIAKQQFNNIMQARIKATSPTANTIDREYMEKYMSDITPKAEEDYFKDYSHIFMTGELSIEQKKMCSKFAAVKGNASLIRQSTIAFNPKKDNGW